VSPCISFNPPPLSNRSSSSLFSTACAFSHSASIGPERDETSATETLWIVTHQPQQQVALVSFHWRIPCLDKRFRISLWRNLTERNRRRGIMHGRHLTPVIWNKERWWDPKVLDGLPLIVDKDALVIPFHCGRKVRECRKHCGSAEERDKDNKDTLCISLVVLPCQFVKTSVECNATHEARDSY